MKRITFKKTNGSVVTRCALQLDDLKDGLAKSFVEPTTGSAYNPHLYRYIDACNGQWRCCLKDNIISVEEMAVGKVKFKLAFLIQNTPWGQLKKCLNQSFGMCS